MGAALAARISADLVAVRAANRHRTLEDRDSPQGVQIIIGGRTLINFTSNDYLGLAADERVIKRVAREINTQGFGSGGAALLSGRSALHSQLERELADFTGMDSAILFSSGYLANLGALSVLIAPQDYVLHDRLNHASLIDAVIASGARHRRYPHCNYQRLRTLLSERTEAVKWVLTESVFSMDGDSAPLQEIESACTATDATLYVDDAHGFGILNQAVGAAASLDPARRRDQVLMITLGKSLGAVGGVVLGPAATIDFLLQHARTFIYDTALPPVCAAAALEALAIVRDQPTRHLALMHNVRHFRRCAGEAGIAIANSQSPIQPILIGDDGRTVAIAAALTAAGFYIRAIRPPTVPPGTARLRITLTASHTTTQIEALVAVLAQALLSCLPR